MTYDPKCHFLAEAWLMGTGDDHDATITRLAQKIQDAIEEFLIDLENEDLEIERRNADR